MKLEQDLVVALKVQSERSFELLTAYTSSHWPSASVSIRATESDRRVVANWSALFTVSGDGVSLEFELSMDEERTSCEATLYLDQSTCALLSCSCWSSDVSMTEQVTETLEEFARFVTPRTKRLLGETARRELE